MRRHRSRFRAVMESLETRVCLSSTTVLPISAFLAQQGHDSVFTPPVPDQIGWSNSSFDPGTGIATREILADYSGQAANYLLAHGINLHTTISGFVTETPIGTNGLMEVSVNLEAKNALTWIANISGIDPNQPGALNTAPLELGYRAQDLVANPSLTPALANAHFQITFVEKVGADLPDLARLNENYALYAPPGFNYEKIDVQYWGTGTLRAGTTVGTPGQAAIFSTSQVADLTNPTLPGTLADGFWQEPIDIIPLASADTHVGYLNGTLFVNDTADGAYNVNITPAVSGGVTVASNIGGGTFAAVSRVIVALANGNNVVQVGNLPGVAVNVDTLDGNNQITVGNASKIAVSNGNRNNKINTANATSAQFISVFGNGNNSIAITNTIAAEVLVAGDGNNKITASGSADSIELLGNGNNKITDTGVSALIDLGGDGNNTITDPDSNSFAIILAGTGHNLIIGNGGYAP